MTRKLLNTLKRFFIFTKKLVKPLKSFSKWIGFTALLLILKSIYKLFLRSITQLRFVILVIAIIGAFLGINRLMQTDFPLIVRDAKIYFKAYNQAGDTIPVEGIKYTYDEFTDTWGLLSNSEWYLNYTMQVVPLFSYEGLNFDPIYPAVMAFVPRAGDDTVTNLGRTEYAPEFKGELVTINDRYMLSADSDMRDLLSTLVHENIHVQKGNFTFTGACGFNYECWAKESVELEAKTTAATLEVLAAMCNLGDDLACSTFWMEVRDFAGTSLNYRLKQYGLEEEWQWFRNHFQRTPKEIARRDKILRYWSQTPEVRENLIYKYSVYPWNDLIVTGMCGNLLNTGILSPGEFGKAYILGLKFDDTQYLFDNTNLSKVITCK